MNNPSPTIILGVDPGSRVTGFAFLKARHGAPVLPIDFDVLDAGVLKAPQGLSAIGRIGLLHQSLFELMEAHKPTVMVLERAFVDRNVGSAFRLGEVRGAYMAAAARLGVDVAEITPAEVKKRLTGNGRADKELVSRTITVLSGFERGKLPHDVTDALAIGYCYGLALASERSMRRTTGGTRSLETL